jgi:hypothetical protein
MVSLIGILKALEDGSLFSETLKRLLMNCMLRDVILSWKPTPFKRRKGNMNAI